MLRPEGREIAPSENKHLLLFCLIVTLTTLTSDEVTVRIINFMITISFRYFVIVYYLFGIANETETDFHHVAREQTARVLTARANMISEVMEIVQARGFFHHEQWLACRTADTDIRLALVEHIGHMPCAGENCTHEAAYRRLYGVAGIAADWYYLNCVTDWHHSDPEYMIVSAPDPEYWHVNANAILRRGLKQWNDRHVCTQGKVNDLLSIIETELW